MKDDPGYRMNSMKTFFRPGWLSCSKAVVPALLVLSLAASFACGGGELSKVIPMNEEAVKKAVEDRSIEKLQEVAKKVPAVQKATDRVTQAQLEGCAKILQAGVQAVAQALPLDQKDVQLDPEMLTTMKTLFGDQLSEAEIGTHVIPDLDALLEEYNLPDSSEKHFPFAAITLGQHILFQHRAGSVAQAFYSPEVLKKFDVDESQIDKSAQAKWEFRALLAHEMTHVMQFVIQPETEARFVDYCKLSPWDDFSRYNYKLSEYPTLEQFSPEQAAEVVLNYVLLSNTDTIPSTNKEGADLEAHRAIIARSNVY